MLPSMEWDAPTPRVYYFARTMADHDRDARAGVACATAARVGDRRSEAVAAHGGFRTRSGERAHY